MSDPLVDLQFQDFGVEPPPKKSSTNVKNAGGEAATTFNFTQFPAAAGDEDGSDDGGELLKSKPNDQSGGKASFWSFAYYQRFFDVDTDIVIRRMINSMIPRFGTNFILHHIRPNPDLYGPWWVAMTLIFTIAIAANLGGYFSLWDDNKDYHWSLDFGVVTAAATAICAYVCLVPLLLYGLFWWRKSEENFSFMEILCAYGYSLSIYVPISILWVFPFAWFQWILIAVGLASSGLVLVIAMWPAVRHDRRLMALSIMIGIIAVNALLAIGFKMFFFHDIHSSRSSSDNKTVTSAAPIISTTKLPTGNITG